MTTTHHDQLNSLVATIADDMVQAMSLAPRNYAAAERSVRDTVAKLAKEDLPPNAIALAVATAHRDVRDGKAGTELRLSAAAVPYPPREILRRAKRTVGKDMDLGQVLRGAVDYLPDYMTQDEPETGLLCQAVLAALLAGRQEASEHIAELRGDPAATALVLLMPVASELVVAAVYSMPRAKVAPAPSFKELLVSLEQGGDGDE